jgi:hypothetical protein
MTGSLCAMAAKGAQDLILTANPTKTFFKSCYRKHTNFAREPIEIPFSGAVDWGRRLQVTITRNGDLISRAFLVLQITGLVDNRDDADSDPAGKNVVHWTNALGFAALDTIELQIGGYTYDTHYGEWLMIHEELDTPAGKELGECVGDFINHTDLVSWSRSNQELIIPLKFWYMLFRDYSLPMISIQYHEVKLNFKLRAQSDLIVVNAVDAGNPTGPAIVVTINSLASNKRPTGGLITDAFLLQEYIYLDNRERYLFASSDQMYLINELQYSGAEIKQDGRDAYNLPLRFNHPCKCFFVVIQRDEVVQGESGNGRKEYFNYSASDAVGGADPIVNMTIALNSLNVMKPRAPKWFRIIEARDAFNKVPDRFIYPFPIAFKPFCIEPSGSTNFSRIDERTLILNTLPNMGAGQIRIYAWSNNKIKISGGMCGKSFAS